MNYDAVDHGEIEAPHEAGPVVDLLVTASLSETAGVPKPIAVAVGITPPTTVVSKQFQGLCRISQ